MCLADKTEDVCLGHNISGNSENSTVNVEDIRGTGSPLGQEDPLEEGLATHTSILA